MLRLITILLLFNTTVSFAQSELTWINLSDVFFTDKYVEEEGAYYYYPNFGSYIQTFDGKEVYITGYMLVFSNDEEGDFHILSRSPFAACFFCGGAGPDSIVELELKPDHPKFDMDQYVTIKGKLRLNADDVTQCTYILEDAEVYKEK